MLHLKLSVPFIVFLFVTPAPLLFAQNTPPAFITYSQKAIVTVKTELIDVSPNTKATLIENPKTKKTYLKRRRRVASYERNATGIIVSSRGHILVNTHTIAHAPNITVKLDDGSEFPAHVIQKAEGHDLTLIKIDAKKPLMPIRWGNSDNLTSQQIVFTLGQPLKMPNILQGKILALQYAKDKNTPLVEAIELNIPLERGDSGSAVIDLEGRFIGMIAARSSHLKSHSFAIPSNLIKHVFNKYLRSDEVSQL